MKLAVVAASLLASVNSQIVHNTAKKLDARCLFEDNIEKLVIDIPYPGADKANILALAAGTCNEISFLTAANDGGRKDVGVDEDMVHLVIPIDACDIRGDVYQTPTVARSYGLIKPTANVTFGQNIAGQDIIFRYLPIAAECGTRTSYTVEFEYNDVKGADTEGCTDVDGVCVFPAYGEEAKFAIKEYTGNDYAVEVDDTNRARTAGEAIFLSMQVTDLTTDLKFAVTECILKQKNDTSSDGITLLNPGEVYDSSVVGSNEPSCKIPEIDLIGTYTDDFTKFNFQHILFLLDATTDTNSFTLKCTIEVCSRDDASSVCNRAAAVCMNDSIDLTDSSAVAEKDRLMENWMCDGLCGVGKEDECSVDADTVSCKACTCDYGTGAVGSFCAANEDELCLSCESGYTLVGTRCALNMCMCDNGVASVGVDCITDGATKCASCDASFTETGGVCVADGDGCGCDKSVFDQSAVCPDDMPVACKQTRWYMAVEMKDGYPWLTLEKTKTFNFNAVESRQPLRPDDVIPPGLIKELWNLERINIEWKNAMTDFPNYFLINDKVKSIHFMTQAFGSSYGLNSWTPAGFNHDEVASGRVCSAMPWQHTYFTLTAESFHPDTFSGMPNLIEVEIYSNLKFQVFDLGASYWNNVKKLQKLSISSPDRAGDCWCDANTEKTTAVTEQNVMFSPGCDVCQMVKYCQDVCGVHPTLNKCSTWRDNQGAPYLSCNKNDPLHNGTWHSRNSGQGNIKLIHSKCQLPWLQTAQHSHNPQEYT